MSTHAIEWERIDAAGDAWEVVNLPARFEVCPDCEGEGYTLQEDIRQHAYTAEEFRESFDEEEAEEYCKGGRGRYGVACKTCKAERVILVVDEAATDPETLKAYQEDQEQRARWNREDAAIRRMESGGY